MPDWIIAVILGIVEGITEFIPVSSTGHLLIAQHFLIAEHFMKVQESDLFNIVIQCGAVVAVIPLFHKRFHQFLFQWREKATQDYLLKIFIAFFITGAIGFVLDKKGLKLPETLLPIAIAMLAGGVAFLLVESWLLKKTPRDEITWPIVVAVGLGQILAAVFPGTSRSGATIILALLLGLNRPMATEFSFLVGIPTMLAAGALKIFKALHHPPADAPHENWSMVLLCTAVSAAISFIAVRWLLRYVQSHTFKAFGWYRIVLGILLLVFALKSHPATPANPSAQLRQQSATVAAIAVPRE